MYQAEANIKWRKEIIAARLSNVLYGGTLRPYNLLTCSEHDVFKKGSKSKFWPDVAKHLIFSWVWLEVMI